MELSMPMHRYEEDYHTRCCISPYAFQQVYKWDAQEFDVVPEYAYEYDGSSWNRYEVPPPEPSHDDVDYKVYIQDYLRINEHGEGIPDCYDPKFASPRYGEGSRLELPLMCYRQYPSDTLYYTYDIYYFEYDLDIQGSASVIPKTKVRTPPVSVSLYTEETNSTAALPFAFVSNYQGVGGHTRQGGAFNYVLSQLRSSVSVSDALFPVRFVSTKGFIRTMTRRRSIGQ